MGKEKTVVQTIDVILVKIGHLLKKEEMPKRKIQKVRDLYKPYFEEGRNK